MDNESGVNAVNSILDVNQLTNDFSQTVPVSTNAGTSGITGIIENSNDNCDKNLAVAKYNSRATSDDIMRINST